MLRAMASFCFFLSRPERPSVASLGRLGAMLARTENGKRKEAQRSVPAHRQPIPILSIDLDMASLLLKPAPLSRVNAAAVRSRMFSTSRVFLNEVGAAPVQKKPVGGFRGGQGNSLCGRIYFSTCCTGSSDFYLVSLSRPPTLHTISSTNLSRLRLLCRSA